MQELDINSFLTPQDLIQKKVGFVAIVGRPNVGKSTFLNTLIGEKISIVSSIPQTTRKKILGIYNDEDSQIIFVDTPGIHFSEKDFNKGINNVALSSLKQAQVILYFTDVSRPTGPEEKQVQEELNKTQIPVIHVYSKTDCDWKGEKPNESETFTEISSKDKKGFSELLEKIKSYFLVGPLLYPDDYYTVQDMYFRVSEIIREKVFLATSEEVPHSVYISVEEIHEENGLYKISAYIICETESQKYILVGKSGDKIKKIATESRKELEKILGKKVFLALRVKVQKNWRKDRKLVQELLQD